VVLDTNVVVSALLSPFGPPARLLAMALAGTLIPCYDGRILAEYAEVLARPKFAFDPAVSAAVIDRIQLTGLAVAARPCHIHLPDEDDRPFLEVAETALAILVTGNLRHYPGVGRAVGVAEFIDQAG
jgi:putative PIN family toxin of toxin-antitoxin system